MRKPTTKAGKQDKMGQCMREYKEGTLHSGRGGPVVTSRKQAQAICLNVSGQSRKR
jgi:hypothetical protein